MDRDPERGELRLAGLRVGIGRPGEGLAAVVGHPDARVEDREREAVLVGLTEHERRDAAVAEVRAVEALGRERPARAVVRGPIMVRGGGQAGLPAAMPDVAGGGMEGRVGEVVHHRRRVAEAGTPLHVGRGGRGEADTAVRGVLWPLLAARLGIDQDHVVGVVGVHLQLGEAALAADLAPRAPAVGRLVDAAAVADDDRLAVRRDVGLTGDAPGGKAVRSAQVGEVERAGEGVGDPDQPLSAGDEEAVLVGGVAHHPGAGAEARLAPGPPLRPAGPSVGRGHDRHRGVAILEAAVDDRQPLFRPAHPDALRGIGHSSVGAAAAVGHAGDDARPEAHAAVGRGVEALVGPGGVVAAAHVAEHAQRIDGIDRDAEALEAVEPEAARQVPGMPMVA